MSFRLACVSPSCVAADLDDLAGAVERLLGREADVKALAAAAAPYHNVLFLGRGPSYAVAREGALKLKEVAYRHAEAMPAGEMKHGPIALIDGDTLSVVL